ncbi:integrase zinc binding domain-containing protein [Aspergillus homomorphus CBS 101889]|uniref:Integrase zinc-binding domain-containing protein n=1 Tax=Aspergillus homomorphus (strain CBS 101889) TaxID=1450537 RepID=A0A395HHN4_ASPHC|nr:hypothetical protein BO97DRAFT_464039 [Aspergillus homomorphus CBS 101889]RAL07327.1 hypothetical protein BO97DRAFT_464039 [Aspergillus homomorphus CBS 101889]
MSGFTRRNDNHDSYSFNHQMALPLPYSHIDNNDFNVNESGAFTFSQPSFHPFTPQFASPFSHAGLSSTTHHLPSSNHSPAHSISSTPDHVPLRQHPTQYLSHSRYIQSPGYFSFREALGDAEIEAQDSSNEHTMLSEPVLPPLEGFPNVREFDQLMKSYVDDLSVKKQDKALIHAKRARNIKTVLLDPKDTAIESAQFRFWVKKMFKLQAVGPGVSDYTRLICHEGKPVAIREKLFKILTRAHQQCQHGGRDKTSAQVRQIYSWVPKELISRFVKICPTCQVRRGGSRLTPPSSRRSSPRLEAVPRSPTLPSPPISRRDSSLNGQLSLDRSQAEFFSQFNSHGNHGPWIDSQRSIHERQPISSVNIRSYGGGALSHLPGSVSGALEPFQSDMSVSSPQVGYGAGYASSHGPSGQRSY